MTTLKFSCYTCVLCAALVVCSGCDYEATRAESKPCLDRSAAIKTELDTARYELQLRQERYDNVSKMRAVGPDLAKAHLEDGKKLMDLKVRIFSLERENNQISKGATLSK